MNDNATKETKSRNTKKFVTVLTVFVFIAMLFCLTACDGNKVYPTGLTLDKTEIELGIGKSATLEATVLPEDATNKKVLWWSSSPAIATVEDGEVTAVAEGTAIITANVGRVYATCAVTVKSDVAVSGISLDKTELKLNIGATDTLVATVSPNDATDKTVEWSSSDDNIATVTNEGVVTAIADGAATITAKAGDKIATCIVTVLPTVSVWDGTTIDTSWYDNNTAATEFVLSSAQELAGLAKLVNDNTDFAGKTITLKNDIDLNGKEWTPIGQKGSLIGKKFNGIFDGNGKTISGLSIQGDYSGKFSFDGYVALFGAVENATIKNITVNGAVQGTNAAGIVARANQGTIIENCINNATITSPHDGKAGGIVCLTNTGGVTIRDCVNNGNISIGNSGVGGIAGYTNSNTIIENCVNNGIINGGNRYGGGIVGYATGENTVIRNCVNTAKISATTNAGGIVGIITSSTTTKIEGCTNSGAVDGGDETAAGGIAGSLGAGIIINSKNTAAVHGKFAGGVAGETSAGQIINCSGGTAPITSPAFRQKFTGQSFVLDVPENRAAGRLLGANGGSDKATLKLEINDTNGDSYEGIATVGICGPYTTQATLEIVSGTFRGEPLAGNATYIILSEKATWDDKTAGKYTCGGLTDKRIETWTKI